MYNEVISASKPPLWFWVAVVIGLAWNIFGLVQFFGTLRATQDSLVASGMTVEQATVMLGYPSWMTVAFAIGVVGGVLGSALLGLRWSHAIMVFWASLLGYIALWVGDYSEGVFASLGKAQMIVLTVVVAIAVALLLLAQHAARKGWLLR